MCMASENCKLQEHVEALDNKVAKIESRVGSIEERVGKLETSITTGFNSVNAAVANLANEFGTRMNTLDQKIVEEDAKHKARVDEERAKWGRELRLYLRWGVITILAGAGVAMGITIWNSLKISN